MLLDQTLAVFADETAARTPTPGGGSVAAYVAVLGAALGTMAARFTEGHKAAAEHAKAVAAEIALLEALRGGFAELVDEDARAYEKVTAAYALPRGTDEQKAARRTAIQSALVEAMETPLKTCRAAVSGLGVLEGLAGHVNPNLASDVAVGAYALGAAYRSAWINVLINLKGIKDDAVRVKVTAEGAELSAKAEALERTIGTSIVASLTS
jgi:glutamate formiminotransferase/formiminotetrahydrofolate cyclodeaminase